MAVLPFVARVADLPEPCHISARPDSANGGAVPIPAAGARDGHTGLASRRSLHQLLQVSCQRRSGCNNRV